MAEKLSYGIRDIPACARYGFGARKIWVFLRSIVMSWMIWSFFVYLGFFAAGADIAARWNESRLLPLPGSLFWMDPVPVILLAVALLLIIHVLMRGSMMVSRITFQQIRGDDFYSTADARRFAREHSTPLYAVPVMLAVAVILILAAGALAGLVSRIPSAGPVLVSLFALPLWGAMLLAILTVAALLLSLKLIPAVVGCTGGDSFETVFEVFSTLTSQPWRLALYSVVSFLCVLSSGALFLLFSSLAVTILSITVTAVSGDAGLAAALASGPRMLAPEILPFFSGLISFGRQGGGEAWTGIAGVIASLSGTVIFLAVISYFLSACSSAWTLVYLALRHRRDGEKLTERADMEEQMEFDRLYGKKAPPDGGEQER